MKRTPLFPGTNATDRGAVSVYGLNAAAVLALGTFVVGTDAFIVAAFLPSMAQELGVTQAMAGQSVTLFALAYAVLAPVIAVLSATVKRRRLLVLALILLGLANLGSAMANSFGLLIASRVAAAAAAAAYTPNAGAAAAAMVRPDSRARALAIVIGGLTAATAFGIPLGHWVSTALSWRATFLLIAALCAAAALCIGMAMPEMPGGARVTLRQRLAVLQHRQVRRILPLTVLGMAACYAPYAFTLPILDGLLGHSESVTAMLLCYGLGAVAGNYLSGWATDRLGPVTVLTGAYALMFCALSAMALAWRHPPVAPVWAAMLMIGWGASSWAQTPAQQHRLIASAPQETAFVIALNSSAIYLGISMGTAIGSQSMQTDANLTLWYGGMLSAAALCYLLMTATRPARQ
ncbi:putative MFS family arabinose efflux permease [Kerstersia gyiorum]|uniref:Putative MFS family arabinose efflux permease n=1 Tax=Kerstersia gyiorum TaxID=206506 RepID=A0A4V2EZ48_9BURK|nr:MFS transporter [Kerstersia gyiorum]KAB0542201.1 MFS transporter [Kerstersia gyiorum]RZS65240.1 putative MFS family arabinose efflux permease [Kerstersia gyiorum]